jgi:hypothetical protein
MRRWHGLVTASVSVVAPLFLLAGTASAATPVAIWNMENPGAMADSSGNGNDGKTTAITSVADPGFGNGYHFGSTSYVTVPDSASLDPGRSDFSFTLRLRFDKPPSAATGDYDLIRKGVAGTTGGEWKMEIFPGGGYTSPAFCLFKDDTKKTATVRGTKNLADGAWHTVTCAKTATRISLTVDDVTKTSAVSLGSIANNQPVSVGRKLGGGDQYVGDMDEVRVESGSAPSGDTTPPTVTAFAPPGGGTGVSRTANVTVAFSEQVTNVNTNTFTLTPVAGGPAVSAVVTFNSTSGRWVLNPSVTLAANTSYLAAITNGVTDLAGNPFAGKSWSFKTGA